ncbi:MAG: hypothetical protein SFU85_02730 [Candidatus Methylacidiphilales bacterium]|nr:hypothetical protein [Candidatus Methylacidiphilales bacterium]
MKQGCRTWLAVSLLAAMQAQAALPPWTEKTAEGWFQKHPNPAGWPAACAELEAALKEEHGRRGTSVFAVEDPFAGWMEHLLWLKAGLASPGLLEDPDKKRAYLAIGSHSAIAREWLRNLTASDNGQKSLEILLQLQNLQPSALAEYPRLGVAYALVFDQPFPTHWPHPQVNPSDIPRDHPEAIDRFNDMVEAQRANLLEIDPRKLGVHELRFVVDSNVSLDELAWARKNIRLGTNKFANAFGMIRYSMPRAIQGQFQWDLGPYTLEAIQTHGGICVDQAYFASVAGKALGIPTLYFHGQGGSGGHAWFGYMEKPGRWNTDCGRYASQNYPVGQAINPQTWQPINDSELEWLVADLPKNPAYPQAWSALAWARLSARGNPDDLLKGIREARDLLPSWPQPWIEEARLLEPAAPGERRAFYEDWIKNFDKQSDLKVQGQQQLLVLLKAAGDPAAAALQKEIVRENRKKRFDLGIDAGAGAIFEKIDSGDWNAAEKEFKSMVRKFDNQGGGSLYYQLVEPYVFSCLEDAQWERAGEAVDYAEKKMGVDNRSILSKEFEDLRRRVESKWQPPISMPGGL